LVTRTPGASCREATANAFPHRSVGPECFKTELGPEFVVIEEGQNGRTTMWDDPGSTVDKNGMRFLPVVLESQKPLDLVIVMLGTNDLKIHLGLSPHAIAHGAGCLIERIRLSDAGPGNQAPGILLVAPAPVAEGPCPFGHLFDGAPARSRQFKEAYEEIAQRYGVGFLNAGDYASCRNPRRDPSRCRKL